MSGCLKLGEQHQNRAKGGPKATSANPVHFPDLYLLQSPGENQRFISQCQTEFGGRACHSEGVTLLLRHPQRG